MSLTSHLKDKNSSVRKFITEQFPNTRSAPFLKTARQELKTAETLRPSPDQGHPYPAIGMAIDYRIRYYFETYRPYETVAYQGSREIRFPHGPNTVPPAYRLLQIIPQFFAELELYAENLQPAKRQLPPEEEIQLNRYCYLLALFEQIFRIGGLSAGSPLSQENIQTVADLLSLPEEIWIADLSQLSQRFYNQFSHLLEQPTILNPTFDGSRDVGGADADFIIDGSLIDIKTSINPQISGDYLHQLLGYVLLDYTNQYQINSIGLYMPRQGKMFQWELEQVLKELSKEPNASITELRDQFQEILRPTPEQTPAKPTAPAKTPKRKNRRSSSTK